MPHHTPGRDDRFATPWALADETTPAGDVIDLTGATHETRRDGHCPACGGTDLDVVTTTASRGYERCLRCGRLWEIDGDARRLVV